MEDQFTQDQNPSDSDIRKSSVKFWGGVGIALALVAAQFLAVIIGGAIAISRMPDDMEGMMQIMVAVALPLSFPIAVWIVLRKRKLSPSAFSWGKNFWILLPIGFLLMYSVTYIIGGILENLPGYDNMVDQYTGMFDSINPVLLIVAGAFIGPICEEIIFRGVILKEFLKTYDPQKAIVFSAIIFGVIHVIPLQVVSAFFAGLVLGYVYYKTQSLWLPIIMHVVHNLIAFLMGVDAELETTREWFDNEVLYMTSFILAVGMVFVLYRVFEKWSGGDVNDEISV